MELTETDTERFAFWRLASMNASMRCVEKLCSISADCGSQFEAKETRDTDYIGESSATYMRIECVFDFKRLAEYVNRILAVYAQDEYRISNYMKQALQGSEAQVFDVDRDAYSVILKEYKDAVTVCDYD